ncbi:uncharacterized protein AKAW2_70102S [Aspergillus luchuensis]|uniref:Uncharacterized protein n=1 Tax=Aspergillus kawachii TaxID=1069201 RepID=A0A7R7WIR1_ASPKA|nr:uncharacterized protein AKAW2_70102S [Aspergillus luchuensis]BCS03224.1 hypothetical protein AKAW2_70102S [Aspergillus luchuensis]BCS14859.1 hypothetical protein ALUC_70092S [Aspergillus luchuensis]GAA84762.1 similar to An16g01360 [Aspergillus luchuensis IFO 4308]
MLPSTDDIAKFISIAPEATEGKALFFLQEASSFDEALDRFYENRDRYSNVAAASRSDSRLQSDHADMRALPPSYESHISSVNGAERVPHKNVVTEAGDVRARDEQEMQNMLLDIQIKCQIYNTDIEPEHEASEFMACTCEIHQYRRRKVARLDVQEMWSKAVMYPGEKAYHDCYQSSVFSNNPYIRIPSAYGIAYTTLQRPDATRYTNSVRQTIALNVALNNKSQATIDAMEPQCDIWALDEPDNASATSSPVENKSAPAPSSIGPLKSSKLSNFRRALSISSLNKSSSKTEEMFTRARKLRREILEEENGRWPDLEWRRIVAAYQEKVGMKQKIAELRAKRPIQYLHMLRAGYFEPIPIAWATRASNPLKFRIDGLSGWRGITPAWRGYENTAEERLYWVLNHREGNTGPRMKPDMISALEMARARMATAVEPPPAYYSMDDTFRLQRLPESYSLQVMPPPFTPFDLPETATDNTMILLDVSGSMDFDPLRPLYTQYLVTGFARSNQPKNKDVAKAIIRRFTDAMSIHDQDLHGYQLVTFANKADYIGFINHSNFNDMWRNVKLGGGTRVMTGWQKIKDLHFQRHSESAIYHPVYGWQAGPRTPMLRLLLLLDGEATDMDEFELDLLGLSWVHVTIFLIGVDGCPHHHRHANELQRISEVNPHVSFVDAQGNAPERYITHELLKRHLGYDVPMAEFERLEHWPASAEPPMYQE